MKQALLFGYLRRLQSSGDFPMQTLNHPNLLKCLLLQRRGTGMWWSYVWLGVQRWICMRLQPHCATCSLTHIESMMHSYSSQSCQQTSMSCRKGDLKVIEKFSPSIPPCQLGFYSWCNPEAAGSREESYYRSPGSRESR